jgi:deoxyuridine 5'-triphosphate nucleotidohydrolase
MENNKKELIINDIKKSFNIDYKELECYFLMSKNNKMYNLNDIKSIFDIKNVFYDNKKYDTTKYDKCFDKIIIEGVDCIDFLNYLYTNYNDIFMKNPSINNRYHYLKYYNWNNEIKTSFNSQMFEKRFCYFIKNEKNAVAPYKPRYSDAGYDLSIIKKIKDFNSKTALYDTGIKLIIKPGYYAELYARSSLSKYGYILANSVGIIDNGYTGTIKVPLIKICDDAEKIEFPFRCCQIIIKKQIYMDLEEEKNENNTKFISSRSNNGFGSSG